jgi:RNA polymerase sigma-70 factor (ECF subfamily)
MPASLTLASCTPGGRGLRSPDLRPLPRHHFDGEYVQRLVHEDPETEQHFTRYFGDLLSLKLRSKLRSPTLVEDAKQETFVRVLAALKRKQTLMSPESLGAFVNSVANNVVFELYRSGSRVSALPEDHDEPDDVKKNAETTLMAAEERLRVRAALDELPAKEKDLLRWLFFEGRDKDEVCRELNIDRNYLRVLLHRAKNRFKDRYMSEEAH